MIVIEVRSGGMKLTTIKFPKARIIHTTPEYFRYTPYPLVSFKLISRKKNPKVIKLRILGIRASIKVFHGSIMEMSSGDNELTMNVNNINKYMDVKIHKIFIVPALEKNLHFSFLVPSVRPA
jgi:hypothetical protein